MSSDAHVPLRMEEIRRALSRHVPARVPSSRAPRRAAVAIILREGSSGVELLLIKRAEAEGDPWSGHMAFPGGRVEEQDADEWQAARRETQEEVGVDLSRSARAVGALDEAEAMAHGRWIGLAVAPCVFEATDAVQPVPGPEVEEFLWVPIAPLRTGELAATRPYDFHGIVVDLPAFRFQNRIIWGLTYRILLSLFRVLDANSADTET